MSPPRSSPDLRRDFQGDRRWLRPRLAALLLATALMSGACEDKRAPSTAPAASVDTAQKTPQPSGAESATVAAPAGSATPASGSAGAPSDVANMPQAIAAQHVLVAYKGAKAAPKGVARSKADAKKLAGEIAAKARDGADFSELARTYSDDPSGKERQGSLGKFTRDKMVQPFSDVAFALEVSQISDPVETPFGFHVIKRNQ